MKKKFGIALVLALVAVMISGGTVLAWDYEDTLVVANEDFWIVRGWDNPLELWSQNDPATWDWIEERHWGGVGNHPKNPADGYNLYRDDVTNTGNLDVVWVYPPSAVDMPFTSGAYEGDFIPNTWYWAFEPRGYDALPNLNPTCLNIILPDASMCVPYYGGSVYAVDFSDGTWAIHIPKGTSIRNLDNSIAVSLVVDSDGNITSDVRFVYCRGGEVTVTGVGS